MEYIRIIMCGLLLASALFNFMVPIYMYRKNGLITKYFSFLSIAIGIYALGYAMELYSNSLGTKLFWNDFQYIGLPFIPAIWMIFTLEYNNRIVRTGAKLSIFVVPLLTMLFRYTSEFNHFYYLSVNLVNNHYFPVLFIQKGPWYWVNVIYGTVCMVIANYLYLATYRKSLSLIRRQSQLMLVASFLPWVSLLLDLLNLSPLGVDYGPLAVTFAVLIFLIAILRYQFLNINPLAKDHVFSSTSDGIIVLDAQLHIIDVNPAAISLFSALRENAIGKIIQDVLGTHSGLMRSIVDLTEAQCDLPEHKGHYKVSTVKIVGSNHSEVGFIVTFTDITKYMDMLEELNYLASKDPLTGIFNRRYFVELCERELELAKRDGLPLALIIFDLDYFKKINDTYGHQAGDMVLREVAGICQYSLRQKDVLGRYGGEEFVILLPQTTLAECHIVSNQILGNIASADIFYESTCIKVTASVGFTGVQVATSESVDDFLSFADQALYWAKAEGRNCVRSIEVVG